MDLALDGTAGNEGIVLWLGALCESEANASQLILLRGTGVTKCPHFVRITDELLNDVTEIAVKLGLTLVGQAHSHAPGLGDRLSPTDRHYGVAFPWYLSIVVPNFASSRSLLPDDCGIYICDERRIFRRQAKAGHERITLTDAPTSMPICVGADR